MGRFKVQAPDGSILTVEAPDGATEQDVLSFAHSQFSGQTNKAPQQKTESSNPAINGLRSAEFASRGFMDSAAETVGAVPDLVATGMRKVGLPAPEENYYTNSIKSGLKDFGQTISSPINDVLGGSFGPNEPTNSIERFAYGGGRGVADAASFMVPAAALAKGAKASSTTSNVAKNLTQQPIMQTVAGAVGGGTAEATDSDMAGLAAGLAVPVGLAGLKRAITPVGNQLSKEELRLAKLAEDNGILLTPGQKTGSQPIQTMESTLTQLPFSAKPQQSIYDGQQKAFNQAVMRTAGVNADNAAPEVLEEAFKRLGATFDDVAARTEVNVDKNFFDEVAQVEKEYGRRLPTDVAATFKSYMQDVGQMLTAANRPDVSGIFVDGRTYQNMSSNIKAASRRSKNRPELQEALNNLSSALDGAMTRSVPDDLAKQWTQARQEYKNLLQIDKAMQGGTQTTRSAGDIPFSGLKTAVQANDRRGYSRGRGALNELSRVGDFLAPKIPNSGTAQRTFMTDLATGTPQTFGGAGVGFMASGGDPALTAVSAATSLALPPMMQKMINSKAGRAYLTNEVMTNASPASKQLLAKIVSAQEVGDAKEAEYGLLKVKGKK